MNNSTAKIIGFSNIDEKLCAASGRISTQEGTALEIWEKSQDFEKNKVLIGKVTRSGHTSTVEHISFNIAFNDVSVVVEQFLIEFRLASFTVKSRRYVDFSNAGYIIPKFDNENLKEKYVSHMNSLFSLYNLLIENNIPKEDARFILPYSFKSNFFCTLNGRELLLVLKEMLYGRGKNNKEIQSLGMQLLNQAKEISPGVFDEFETRNQLFDDQPDFSEYFEKYEEKKDLVELLGFSNDAEKNIMQSALIQNTMISTSKIDKILQDTKQTEKIIAKIVASHRARALENAIYTFRLNNVSLACLTHFTRHRMQSINIPNLSNTSRKNYIIPPVLKNNKELLKKYKDAFEKTYELYCEFKEQGVDSETLKYLLLSGNVLDITMTMNARELLLFLRLRTCSRAQWEIQIYSNKMLELLRVVSPSIFKFFGPSCFLTNNCPEGRLSCGQLKEMNEKYSL